MAGPMGRGGAAAKPPSQQHIQQQQSPTLRPPVTAQAPPAKYPPLALPEPRDPKEAGEADMVRVWYRVHLQADRVTCKSTLASAPPSFFPEELFATTPNTVKKSTKRAEEALARRLASLEAADEDIVDALDEEEEVHEEEEEEEDDEGDYGMDYFDAGADEDYGGGYGEDGGGDEPSY